MLTSRVGSRAVFINSSSTCNSWSVVSRNHLLLDLNGTLSARMVSGGPQKYQQLTSRKQRTSATHQQIKYGMMTSHRTQYGQGSFDGPRPGKPVHIFTRNASNVQAKDHPISFKKVLNQPKDRRSFVETSAQALKSQAADTGLEQQTSKPAASIFAQDSTILLMKKLVVYKLMGSNLFINNALGMMTTCYSVLGIPITNTAINKSVGSLFTSGETIKSLIDDIAEFQKRNISGMAGCAVEGLQVMDEAKINEFHQFMIDTIKAQTEGGKDGHLAIRLSAFITMDIMRTWNKAQKTFLYDILALNQSEELSLQQLNENLKNNGVHLSTEQVTTLFDYLKIDEGDTLNRIDRYANGHLFQLNYESHPIESIFKSIVKDLGFSESDLQIFEKFAERVNQIGQFANDRNCRLYIDAEQSFLQNSLESFAQQLTQRFNQGETVTILNGYQCYLKRMSQVIQDEIASSQSLGYNLGIKLIRGAYMNEERQIAAEQGVESPVWDTIDDTHACYNLCMSRIMENMEEHGMLFIASHNKDSVQMAKEIMEVRGLDASNVHFGQLKGFSDQITNSLAQENYRVFKYLPYGPTETVMPYLIRRGQESKQVLREQEFQNVFLKSEIKKRINPFNTLLKGQKA